MTKKVGPKADIKQIMEDLEISLQQIQEIEKLQVQLRQAYRVPYPVPFKFNLAVTVILYILYKQGMPYGQWLLLAWLGWQVCVNGIYFTFKLYKKMPQIAQWKNKINLNIEALEKDCIVPQQYWYTHAIQHFIQYLKSGKAKNLEECISIYEED